MCCKVIKSYWWNWWNNIQIWLVYSVFHIVSLTWCGAIRSEGVNQRCLYRVLLICLAVSRNTHMSVFISVPSQAPLEGQVIAFWLYLFPSAFHFRYLLQEILPGNTLPRSAIVRNLTDWSLNKYIKVSLLLCYDEMLLLYRGRNDQFGLCSDCVLDSVLRVLLMCMQCVAVFRLL